MTTAGDETVAGAFDKMLGGNGDARIRVRGGRWFVSMPIDPSEPTGRQWTGEGATLLEASNALNAIVDANWIVAVAS